MATPTFECAITTPMALNETNSAKGTLRWFVPKTEYDPRACEFRYLVNGQQAFGTLYQDLLNAKHSIDIICWGFQPSMHFVRDGSKSMSIGELLAHKGEKDTVKVRLLCWHDPLYLADGGENNMPGFDRNITSTKRILPDWVYKKFSLLSPDYQTGEEALFDCAWYWRASFNNVTNTVHKKTRDQLLDEMLQATPFSLTDSASRELFRRIGGFKNLELATRSFDASERQEIIGRIKAHGKSAGWSPQLVSGMTTGMGLEPTHHQKTVLIDYEHPDIAVGYVMGHNMLDQYWDTDAHTYQPTKPTQGRSGPSPWQDISSRVTGPVLQDINANFCQAWDQATGQKLTEARKKLGVEGKHALCLAGSATERGVMAQVLRTQSQQGKTDIGKLYLQALNNATQYVFVQNQYFRWQDFADTIKQTVNRQTKGGRDPSQHGAMYLFVITNASDAAVGDAAMTTYQMLDSLGYGDRMPGVKYAQASDQLASKKAELQSELAKEQQVEQRMKTQGVDFASVGGVMNYLQDSENRQRGMWSDIGEIEKQQKALAQETGKFAGDNEPEPQAPQNIQNLKVMICTLVAPDTPDGVTWVPVYVHAKLMVIDDAFMTLGSANINFRSMNVDSEINICLENGQIATGLREKLWELHTRGGGYASAAASSDGGQSLDLAHRTWTNIVNENRTRKNKNKAPKGSLVEFYRSSSSRTYKD